MEVRQLQIFCALAYELNFTRTAERVHTVQSNVTTQIRALEEELVHHFSTGWLNGWC
jgi:DNA-binding transcriptional LysR family regulator